MQCFSCDLQGADNFILRTGVAVQDLGDLVPAGLDGGADSINFLQTSFVCRRRWHEVLLVGEPPEDGWQAFMIVLVSSESLTVCFNLRKGNVLGVCCDISIRKGVWGVFRVQKLTF